jgi:hypothetical protein
MKAYVGLNSWLDDEYALIQAKSGEYLDALTSFINQRQFEKAFKFAETHR